ncbi:hypothetical protein RhiirB3_529353, partial [Rhizophagus irregularis]
ERLENSLEGPWETPGKPQKDLGTVLEDLRKKLENGLGGPQTSGNDLGTVLETSGNSLGKAIVDAVL